MPTPPTAQREEDSFHEKQLQDRLIDRVQWKPCQLDGAEVSGGRVDPTVDSVIARLDTPTTVRGRTPDAARRARAGHLAHRAWRALLPLALFEMAGSGWRFICY